MIGGAVDDGTLADHGVPGRAPTSVSVIIPAYNERTVLPIQLDALRRQTYQGDWELIVVDNGSTDDTPDVVDSYRDRLPGLRLISTTDVRGPAHARNVGAHTASGELLLFCDADDVVAPRWLEAMVDASPRAHLLGGWGRQTHHPEQGVAGQPVTPERYPFLPWVKTANLGIWRETFHDVKGFDEARSTGEDVDLCWRVQLAGYRYSFVPTAVVAYRERDDLRGAMRRRFAFGYAAHDLYRSYQPHGAPRPDLRWALRGTLRTSARSVRIRRASELKLWLSSLAGIAGRFVAVVQHLAQR